MSKTKPITFLASLPEIQGAIKVGADGMRLALDIPESEMGQAVFLVAMRGKRLRVTITEDENTRPSNKLPITSEDFKVQSDT